MRAFGAFDPEMKKWIGVVADVWEKVSLQTLT